jgi:hypothetical protein
MKWVALDRKADVLKVLPENSSVRLGLAYCGGWVLQSAGVK